MMNCSKKQQPFVSSMLVSIGKLKEETYVICRLCRKRIRKEKIKFHNAIECKGLVQCQWCGGKYKQCDQKHLLKCPKRPRKIHSVSTSRGSTPVSSNIVTPHRSRPGSPKKSAQRRAPSSKLLREGSWRKIENLFWPESDFRVQLRVVGAKDRARFWRKSIPNILFITPNMIDHLECQLEKAKVRERPYNSNRVVERHLRLPGNSGVGFGNNLEIKSEREDRFQNGHHRNPSENGAKHGNPLRKTADFSMFDVGDGVLDSWTRDQDNAALDVTEANSKCTCGVPRATPGQSNPENGTRHLHSEACVRKAQKMIADLQQIQLDLPRTFAKEATVQNKDFLEKMKYVLQMFVVFRPDIGFVQGMSYLAVQLLRIFKSKKAAFVCYANLLCSNGFFKSFFATADILNDQTEARVSLLKILLEHNCRGLMDHFDKIGFTDVQLKNIFIQWCTSMFVRVLGIGTIADIVWDNILAKGETYIYVTATAMMMLLEMKLMEKDFGDCSELLQTLQTFKFEFPQVKESVEKVQLNEKFKRELKLMKQKEKKDEEKMLWSYCDKVTDVSGAVTMCQQSSTIDHADNTHDRKGVDGANEFK